MIIKDVCQFLDEFAPPELAEDWDNVGLILGDANRSVSQLMTCLTITPESAAEAIDAGVDLIVAHHPLPFSATKRITTQHTPTRLIWGLARAGISVYSPHTSFDSAAGGINQMLADRLSLENVKPLVPNRTNPELPGAGRIGKLSQVRSLQQFAQTIKDDFELPRLQLVGSLDRPVQRIATACGSGGSFVGKAVNRGADCLVTGEATFHAVLEAKASGIGMILMGHYFSERFAVESLAEKIAAQFPDISAWASTHESDPLISI